MSNDFIIVLADVYKNCIAHWPIFFVSIAFTLITKAYKKNNILSNLISEKISMVLGYSISVIFTSLLLSLFLSYWDKYEEIRTLSENIAELKRPLVHFSFSDLPEKKYVESASSRRKASSDDRYNYWSIAIGVITKTTLDNACINLVEFKSIENELPTKINSPFPLPWWVPFDQFKCRQLNSGETKFEVMNSGDSSGRRLLLNAAGIDYTSPFSRLKRGRYEFTVDLRSSSLPPPGDIKQTYRFTWSGDMTDFQMAAIDEKL